MTINSIYSYMQSIDDISVAKIILEALSDPNGYYFGIYSDIKKSINKKADEKRIKKIINKYYETSQIDHYEYLKAVSFFEDENIFRKLLGQEKFSHSISKISTKDELSRYLYILKKKQGEMPISFDTYVPRYKAKKIMHNFTNKSKKFKFFLLFSL